MLRLAGHVARMGETTQEEFWL